ncbi:hypothetical protein C9E85_12220 [Plesiomonas shigelloides]|uniref:PP2C family serine/threonine-protein phosphatase n=1 Tax=Plesiomonas shigelloides TaxID=703 RepID=UPI000D5858C1|nr:PP2C family serine/threonine-protein phosphatase [Plesiomonas shigelloides]PVU65610.1 hypothetical protein C9E85_12220 [Plesiomonas shigelloides]
MSISHYQPLLAQHYLYCQSLARQRVSLAAWHAVAAESIGYRHVQQALPCQDKAAAHAGERPRLVLCDGAGSAVCSEQGSQALVQGMQRLLVSIEPMLAQYLDDEVPTEAEQRQLALIFMRHAKGINGDLARNQRRSGNDFRSTLLLAVAGKRRLFWLQIGDGVLAVRHNSEMGAEWSLLNVPNKGEYANQTDFVDPQLNESQARYGVYPTGWVSGVVAMSDGAAERLFSAQHHRFAPLLETWCSEHSRAELIHEHLSHVELWKKTSGDDKSVALLVSEPKVTKAPFNVQKLFGSYLGW